MSADITPGVRPSFKNLGREESLQAWKDGNTIGGPRALNTTDTERLRQHLGSLASKGKLSADDIKQIIDIGNASSSPT